jgi:hypothetical protein
MNRSAIALAADSAVTIRGPRAFKTFDTANKLFELIKGSNVGVMVYNNMVLNGTPWETIIKAYREEHSNFSAGHVSDYLDHFLQFVANSKYVLPPEDDTHGAITIAFDGLVAVADQLQERYAEYVTQKGKIVKTKLAAVLREICDEWEQLIDDMEDAPAAQKLPPRALKAAFNESLRNQTSDVFQAFDLSSTLINRLTNLSLRSLPKEGPYESESGLVFAGFGAHQYFPSFSETAVTARLLGQTVYRTPEFIEVSADAPGHIRTFAQDEPAIGWITGISNQTRSLIAGHWSQWVRKDLPSQLAKRFPVDGTMTRALRNKIAKEVLVLANERLGEFFNFMNAYEQIEFIQPMFDSVGALPKDELGLLAESLVNITSLKQRMSVHLSNTVGGAIDVAIISIGDGFVWINRKHYFDERFNPTWHLTHGARINT